MSRNAPAAAQAGRGLLRPDRDAMLAPSLERDPSMSPRLKTVDIRNAITVSQAVGTWKKIIFAFSSNPGINGNSYQALGFSTIGNAIPAIDTKAKSKNKKIFQIIKF